MSLMNTHKAIKSHMFARDVVRAVFGCKCEKLTILDCEKMVLPEKEVEPYPT